MKFEPLFGMDYPVPAHARIPQPRPWIGDDVGECGHSTEGRAEGPEQVIWVEGLDAIADRKRI